MNTRKNISTYLLTYFGLFTLSYEKDIEELKTFYNIIEDLKRLEAKEGKKKSML